MLCSFLFRYPHNPVNARVYRSVGPLETSHLRTLQALSFLARAGRVDMGRVLVLRTGSNYTIPPPGMSAAESLTAMSLTQNPGYLPALDAAYLVGRKVVDEIIENWAVYGDTNPSVPSRS